MTDVQAPVVGLAPEAPLPPCSSQVLRSVANAWSEREAWLRAELSKSSKIRKHYEALADAVEIEELGP